jgi:ectoine hydroxylase-related dioxygenase (phytanoyl-CoA dioxygenase family)
MSVLSPEQIAQYQQDGYTILRNALSAEEVSTLRSHIEGIASGDLPFPEANIEFDPNAPQQRHIDHLRKINGPSECDAFFHDHAAREPILTAAADLLGPDLKLYGDQIFIKGPGGIEKTYHQDSAYFHIEPMDLATAWVALDDVTLENGCLWVVPGSHREGLVDHSEVWMVGERQDKKVPDAAIDHQREQPILLQAGDCSFHHSLLLHRSGPNQTATRRRGMATHYMSARSRWTGRPEEKPEYPLLRGQEHAGCV